MTRTQYLILCVTTIMAFSAWTTARACADRLGIGELFPNMNAKPRPQPGSLII